MIDADREAFERFVAALRAIPAATAAVLPALEVANQVGPSTASLLE